MRFHNIDMLIGSILDCVESHIDGRNEKTRRRRGAIVDFFHKAVVLVGSEMPGIEVLLENVLVSKKLFLTALESPSAKQLSVEAHDELVKCVNDLYVVIPCLEKMDNDDLAVTASVICLQALQSVFDWNEPARLQAYVFARTDEFLEEGLLWKERSELMDHVHHCAEEIEDE